MKCKSVACIWSSSPPVHKITAAAVLRHPPTLYTGGSDGSIIRWKISSFEDDDVSSEIRPVAMLCGHAAPVADLGICFPTAGGKMDDTSNAISNSKPSEGGALISACTDGVLCVWSRTSGHCTRRRKMPPWVGVPSMIRSFPENPRYVCIACCFSDHLQLNDHWSSDALGDGGLTDGESRHGKRCKCAVVIVDTYSLTIVQTVFHGNLPGGPLKSIALVFGSGVMENLSVVIVDIYGKIQYVPILKDSDANGGSVATAPGNTSDLELAENLNGLNDKGLLVSFANCGQVLALTYRTCCVFKMVGGTTIGEISLLADQLCAESDTHIIGGIFLGNTDATMRLNTGEPDNVFAEEFVAWNNRGSAVIFKISYSSSTFNFEPLSAIPHSLSPLDVKLSIHFIQLNNSLIRLESIRFHREEPSLWRPHVTLWSLTNLMGTRGKLALECKCLGESQYLDDWIVNCESTGEEGVKNGTAIKETTGDSELTSQSYAANKIHTNGSIDLCQKLDFVSSSMVVSGNYYTPSAIVYGFFSGEIEIVRLDMFFEAVESHGISPHPYVDSCPYRQRLSGHTGAVLCFAAHRIMNSSSMSTFNNVLVSGSRDWTVRLWDLDSSTPIIVMHQHVGPVRQIILPPSHTNHPWSNCFLSVGEDSCVSLTSFDTFRVERMFPGHPHYPARVLWDSSRGYIACLCPNQSGMSDGFDVLYIWDVKTGARERVLHGSAAHSMSDHFFIGINKNAPSGSLTPRNTSTSSLHLPINEETRFLQSQLKISRKEKENNSSTLSPAKSALDPRAAQPHSTSVKPAVDPNGAPPVQPELSVSQSNNKLPVKSSCPFPGSAALCFDLTSLMSLCKKYDFAQDGNGRKDKINFDRGATETPKNGTQGGENAPFKEDGREIPSPSTYHSDNASGAPGHIFENHDWVLSLEGYLLQFSLSLLHLWNVDNGLDQLLVDEMKLKRPDDLKVACGILGDRGALTLAFPSLSANIELWKSSPEYCALRSLTMVSLAQHLIGLSHTCSAANGALAAFYTRNFAEKNADIRPPSLQLLVSFWQSEVEHVKMAARSLFHCAASRAIPLPLCSQKANEHANFLVNSFKTEEGQHASLMLMENDANNLIPSELSGTQNDSEKEESEILSWLESFEMEDWVSCVGGTSQDGMTSHIIVAAALAVWYPSLVKPSLAKLVVHPLVKLVMTMNERYSCTAAEILAEGMENTWKYCIGPEIPRLLGDVFFQIECLSRASVQNPAASLNIRDILVGILLPSLAMVETPGFLNIIQSQIWSTASDSPVHVVSLMTLFRVVRGSPRNLAQYLHKVVMFILQTMDPGNSVMRKTCLQSSMAALREVIRVFPMIALNDTSTRLADGDAIAEINSASIRIYDMQSMAMIKVLDASGPPGLPTLLGGTSGTTITTAISALSFSPDGEVLVAFSENGLMIRWWSLGSVWWEKLSRNLTPVQCTKVIFVPPWEGFSPNLTRSSIMASVMSSGGEFNSRDNKKGLNEFESLKLLIHNLDLSYQLEWVGQKKIKLVQHGRELGIFQL